MKRLILLLPLVFVTPARSEDPWNSTKTGPSYGRFQLLSVKSESLPVPLVLKIDTVTGKTWYFMPGAAEPTEQMFTEMITMGISSSEAKPASKKKGPTDKETEAYLEENYGPKPN